jgi:sugar fermentation stimulation protein A
MPDKKRMCVHRMAWPPLIRGRLVKRYKRFLADVVLDDGRTVTAHCPNSGRMTECSLPGQPVYLSSHDNPKRKLKYTWEIIEMPTSLVGVNTLVPNRLVAESIQNGCVPALEVYRAVHREVRVNSHSRLDLKLTAEGLCDCFVEIKNCTLVRSGCAMFPDAPTERGRKHLQELAALKKKGKRAVIFFLVQRSDADCFAPADDVDPAYGRQLRRTIRDGVDIMVWDVVMDLDGIALGRSLPCRFETCRV